MLKNLFKFIQNLFDIFVYINASIMLWPTCSRRVQC